MVETTSASKPTPFSIPDIDFILTAQLILAWAGEGGEEPRLSWWKSDLISEFGGEDLFQQLLPHTWRWAVFQAAREAARKTDREKRAQYHDPDGIVSLFSLDFEVDERVDERLQDLKRSGASPVEALPTLREVITKKWNLSSFTKWLESHGKVNFATEPIGRRIKGDPPSKLIAIAGQLLAAFNPPADQYPLPHFRRPG